jgi:hypothetical protein
LGEDLLILWLSKIDQKLLGSHQQYDVDPNKLKEEFR